MAQWKMKQVLDRNRSLLKASSITEPAELNEEPAQWLVRRGFNFHYHTHIEPRPDGSVAVMCFDQGYVNWVATESGQWTSNRSERYLSFLDFALPDLRFFS